MPYALRSHEQRTDHQEPQKGQEQIPSLQSRRPTPYAAMSRKRITKNPKKEQEQISSLQSRPTIRYRKVHPASVPLLSVTNQTNT